MQDFNIPKHSVVQYVRKKRIPYGVILAVKSEEGFRIGYSLCNRKDRFSKKMALKIALGRADTINPFGGHGHDSNVSLSGFHEINKMMPNFINRCKKYYKVG